MTATALVSVLLVLAIVAATSYAMYDPPSHTDDELIREMRDVTRVMKLGGQKIDELRAENAELRRRLAKYEPTFDYRTLSDSDRDVN